MEQTPACQGIGAPSKAGMIPQTSALWSFNKTQGTHRHLEWNQCCTKNTHRLWNTLDPGPARTQCPCCVTPGSQVASALEVPGYKVYIGHKVMHTKHEIQSKRVVQET